MLRRNSETGVIHRGKNRTDAAQGREKEGGAGRGKLGILFLVLGSLMLLSAGALFAYNIWDDWRAGNAVAQIQAALETAVEARNTTINLYLEFIGAYDADEAVDEEVPAEMDVVEIDGYDYIGTLSVSRYGLELPIMSEWSYAGLKIAPGRYSGSVKTNDLVICGHNYERHFGNLVNLEAGDEIAFTDVDGNVYCYVVVEVVTLQPTDIEEMVSEGGTAWDLTLFTCTVSGQARVTVRCSRITMVQ